MRKSFCLVLALAVLQLGWAATAQDITGGGSLVHDISGGAALIFRAPQNPSVHLSNSGGATGGGRVKQTRKPPARQQDPIIARANAARRAPKPRYEEAEQQSQLAAQIVTDIITPHHHERFPGVAVAVRVNQQLVH